MVVVLLSASAQSWLDYDQALSRHLWLRTANAAALATYQPTDTTQRLLAQAQVGIATGQGHLTPLNQSPNAWQVQADARAIYRMSHRVVTRGSMVYRNAWGTKAGGSVWVNPEQMPFDIIETADSTRGKVGMESYRLTGEVGVSALQNLSLGATIAYETASYAKKKDPRHTNQLMQLDASVGATWQTASFTLGANYLLRRTTEGMQFSTYGRTDQVYRYLIDQGACFGRDEQAGGRGYVGNDYERPYQDMRHGVALQAGYEQGRWSVLIEGQWLRRHGHYGLESPSMLDFNRHHGDEWHLRSWWQHALPATIHRITAQWSHLQLSDLERTYRIISQGGVTDTEYYDDRLLGEHEQDRLSLAYDMEYGIQHQLAQWQAHIAVDYQRRDLTASLYPYYRQQHTHSTTLTVAGRRSWLLANDQVWSLRVQTAWSTGGGTAAGDGTYVAPSHDATPPAEYTALLMRQYEWLTATRLGGEVALRWSLPMMRHRLRFYVDACYGYTHALDPHWLTDAHRHTASVVLGCLF